MQRINHSDYHRLLDFIAVLQEPVLFKDFGAMLVRAATDLLPGAVIAFDQIHERAGDFYAIDHNVPLDLADQTRMHARLQDVYQQNPIYAYIQAGGVGPVVDLDCLMSKRDFRRTDFYQDIFRPYAINHQVSLMLNREGWINTMTVNHEKRLPDRVKTMLVLSSRYIGRAHQRTCEVQQLKSSADVVEKLLTVRELEVFHWLGQGKRNAEIAVILQCGARTVEKHVENILRKTSAENRMSAVLCL